MKTEQERETVVQAVELWKVALEQSIEAKWAAELAEAQAILSSDGKNDAQRKAHATIASAEQHVAAGKAKARALAAEAIVTGLLGHPVGVRL